MCYVPFYDFLIFHGQAGAYWENSKQILVCNIRLTRKPEKEEMVEKPFIEGII